MLSNTIFCCGVDDVVVEEAVHHPHLERGARILGDQPHRSGMMEPEMLDDDARLDHRAAVVDEHGKALERPQRFELGRRLIVAGREHAELEGGVVLVERDQHLLAVGGEGMGVELQGHSYILGRLQLFGPGVTG